jgi:hypothetical protein
VGADVAKGSAFSEDAIVTHDRRWVSRVVALAVVVLEEFVG